MDDLDREWQAEQQTLAGQMELLQVRLNLLGEAILAVIPRWLRDRLQNWLVR
jgi:hypothetical protein